MKIRLDGGREFEAKVITQSLRNPDALLMEIEDVRLLSQIAADFEGVGQIEKVAEGRKTGVTEILTGYKRLTAISRTDAQTVRLTLEGVSAT